LKWQKYPIAHVKTFCHLRAAANSIKLWTCNLNLQYNTLVCWADGTNDSWTKHNFLQTWGTQNSLFPFLWFYEKIEKSIERVLQRILQDFMKKIIILGTIDAWSTSHLSHWPNEPANQRFIL
jgi:hypothetical protein